MALFGFFEIFSGKTKVCVVVEARAAPVLTIELKLTSVHGIHKWPKMDNKSTISSSLSKSCIQIIAVRLSVIPFNAASKLTFIKLRLLGHLHVTSVTINQPLKRE